jgi:hypothetical protein
MLPLSSEGGSPGATAEAAGPSLVLPLRRRASLNSWWSGVLL